MSKRKILMVLVCALAMFAFVSTLRAETRKYLKIGGDPHPAVAGNFFEGETEFSLPKDLQVLTVGGSGREYTGWLHIGEVLIVKGDWVVRIKKCGNPVYFPNHQRVGMECFRTEVASSEQEYEYAEVPIQPQVVYQPQPQVVYQPQPQQFTPGAPVQQSVVVYSQPQQPQQSQVIEENRGSIWGEVLGSLAYGVVSGLANNSGGNSSDRDRNYHRPQQQQQQYYQPQRQQQQYHQPQRQQYQQPQRPTRPTRPSNNSGGPAPYRPNGSSNGNSSGGPHPYQPNGPAGSRGN